MQEDEDLDVTSLIESDKANVVKDTVDPNAVTISRLRAEYGDAEVHRMLGNMRLDLVNGKDEAETAATYHWSVEMVRALREAVYMQERLIVRRSPEETFIDYALRQEGCARELNDLIPSLRADPKSIGAAVTAIKVKSDILERVLKAGQDLDIISKAPKRHQVTVVDGIDVSGMSDPALRQLTMKVLSRFQRLVGRYGEFEEVAEAAVQDPHLSREMPENRRVIGRGVDRAKAARVTARTAMIERVRGTSEPD